MARPPIQYIAPTKRKPMTKRRSVKIFLSRNGECCLCHEQIISHIDKWYIEHPEAVNLGGSDDDADLWPAHYRCKPDKDAADMKLITERNDAIAKNCVSKPRSSRPMPCGRNSEWKKPMGGGPAVRRT